MARVLPLCSSEHAFTQIKIIINVNNTTNLIIPWSRDMQPSQSPIDGDNDVDIVPQLCNKILPIRIPPQHVTSRHHGYISYSMSMRTISKPYDTLVAGIGADNENKKSKN